MPDSCNPQERGGGRRPRMLSPEQIRTARELWRQGTAQAEVAQRIGVTIDTFKARLRDQLADMPARPRRVNSGRRGCDPTEDEIYGRLTLIEQAAWSDAEREQRWRGIPGSVSRQPGAIDPAAG